MSERDQTRKFTAKSAAIASERLKAAAGQATRAVQQSYSVTVDNIRDFNVKMIDMAQANTEAVFELARQLATATTGPLGIAATLMLKRAARSGPCLRRTRRSLVRN